MIAETSSFASAWDMNLVIGDVSYYGVLTEVVELHYLGGNIVLLFNCDWWNITNIKKWIKKMSMTTCLSILHESY